MTVSDYSREIPVFRAHDSERRGRYTERPDAHAILREQRRTNALLEEIRDLLAGARLVALRGGRR